MSDVKRRLGTGKKNDDVNSDFVPINLIGFTFDSTVIRFDTTVRKFDETR